MTAIDHGGGDAPYSDAVAPPRPEMTMPPDERLRTMRTMIRAAHDAMLAAMDGNATELERSLSRVERATRAMRATSPPIRVTKRSAPPIDDAKRDDVVRMVRSGSSYPDVALATGLTYATVRRIAAAAGVRSWRQRRP